ncbi:hypothetical protein AB0B27_06645 [Micromonospora rifamycinica]|uniref:hypothetical protein n=1 Tax=Micromonospora rifamycinica TaxID=291594 RepID=UPI0033E45776
MSAIAQIRSAGSDRWLPRTRQWSVVIAGYRCQGSGDPSHPRLFTGQRALGSVPCLQLSDLPVLRDERAACRERLVGELPEAGG